eukprot:11155317-Lingulodinium_polyedra.AAC.1
MVTRAGNMLVVCPDHNPRGRNQGMQRARWSEPEVVTEFDSVLMREEVERCNGSIRCSFTGSAVCNFVVPPIYIGR